MKYLIFFLIAAVAVLSCTGCWNDQKKVEKQPSLQDLLSRNLKFQFQNPGIKQYMEEKKFDFQKVRIHSKTDVEKIFKDILPGEVIEKTSAGKRSDDQEKMFLINQTVSGIPVFAATTVLQCNKSGEITRFRCNFSVPAIKLKAKSRKITPELQKKLFGKTNIKNVREAIFDPELMGKEGNTVFVWQVDVNNKRILINQKTEKEVFSYSLHTLSDGKDEK